MAMERDSVGAMMHIRVRFQVRGWRMEDGEYIGEPKGGLEDEWRIVSEIWQMEMEEETRK